MRNPKTVAFVVISLVILIFLFIFFVYPGNIIPMQSYRGVGGPFLNPPRG
jgi:uncharacterized membrane protein